MSGEEKAPLNILWHGSGDNSLQPTDICYATVATASLSCRSQPSQPAWRGGPMCTLPPQPGPHLPWKFDGLARLCLRLEGRLLCGQSCCRQD